MKLSDAAHVLSLTGYVTPDDIIQAYRKAAMKYHPDRNPAGIDLMKLVNAAFEMLKGWEGDLGAEGATEDGGTYPEELSQALNAILDLKGITIEVCGAWVWVSGNTYPYKSILKDATFRYAAKKKRWYFRPDDWESRSRGKYSMEQIRDTFGSSVPKSEGKKRLANA